MQVDLGKLEVYRRHPLIRLMALSTPRNVDLVITTIHYAIRPRTSPVSSAQTLSRVPEAALILSPPLPDCRYNRSILVRFCVPGFCSYPLRFNPTTFSDDRIHFATMEKETQRDHLWLFLTAKAWSGQPFSGFCDLSSGRVMTARTRKNSSPQSMTLSRKMESSR